MYDFAWNRNQHIQQYRRHSMEVPLYLPMEPWTPSLQREYGKTRFYDPERVDAVRDRVRRVDRIAYVDAFQKGNLAMIDLGSNYIVRFDGVLGFNWDIAMMPRGPVKRVSYSGPDSVGIARTTKHPQEAWKLLRYMVDNANFGGGRIPMNRALATSEDWVGKTPYPSRKDILFEMAPDGMGASFGSKWIQWWGAASAEIATAFRGERAPQAALQAATTVIDAILQDAYRE